MTESKHSTFPNFEGKHAQASMFTPQDFFSYMREQGRLPDISVPPSIIMCYSPWLMRQISKMPNVESVVSPTAGTFHLMPGGKVGVAAGFGIGAPAAASVLEELTAFGASQFVSIGAAGALQRNLREGDVVLCTAAIRDEGVSHHYSEPGHLAHPSKELTGKVKSTLEHLGIPFVEGTSWTIDAPYRETVAEARHYQGQGVMAVEMEAAALFTVANYRSVEVAAAFVASDSLAEMTWTPRFGTREVRDALMKLFEAGVAACGAPSER